MAKSQSYVVKTTVNKFKQYSMDKYKVIVEGSGFTGEGEAYGLGQAFDNAYQDLMAKVSEAIFQEE